MDWKECINKREIKKITPDIEMANSLKKTSLNKELASNELSLREETAAAKISLSYDSVREVLESLSLKLGYKIYNHACYTQFLKEILKRNDLAEDFDELRRMRNDINYYGKQISITEARHILFRLATLLKELRRLGS